MLKTFTMGELINQFTDISVALGARGEFYKTGLLYRARSIDRRLPRLEYME